MLVAPAMLNRSACLWGKTDMNNERTYIRREGKSTDLFFDKVSLTVSPSPFPFPSLDNAKKTHSRSRNESPNKLVRCSWKYWRKEQQPFSDQGRSNHGSIGDIICNHTSKLCSRFDATTILDCGFLEHGVVNIVSGVKSETFEPYSQKMSVIVKIKGSSSSSSITRTFVPTSTSGRIDEGRKVKDSIGSKR